MTSSAREFAELVMSKAWHLGALIKLVEVRDAELQREARLAAFSDGVHAAIKEMNSRGSSPR